MDFHNFFLINLFLIACINFSQRLNPNILTWVRGYTLLGYHILFFNKKIGFHIWFLHTWKPVVQFSFRASLVMMP
jgi:hypothetical protein